jgi:hydroxymethylglutaryl-CoA synthase
MIADAWAARSSPGQKRVAHFDEDALTMAQAAVWRLRSSVPAAQALYFASTSSPYWQRSAASLIAAACDLSPETRTADFGGSLRAGLTAMGAAFDAVRAGNSKDAVVVSADVRDATGGSPEELALGDAAAAAAIGEEHVVAELIAASSRSDNFLDEWRCDVDRYVNSFASKFSTTRGYEASTVAVGRALLKLANAKPGDIARLALASPDGRAQLNVAKALDIPDERVQETRLCDVGLTGAAMPLLVLAQALDGARPGDLILCVGYGEGAEGFLFQVTDEIGRLPRPLVGDSRALEYPTYQIYRKLRDYLREEISGPDISNVLWEREEPQNMRLHATFCPKCEAVQFPMTRVCPNCRNTTGLCEKPLEHTGTVFTFNKDYLYNGPVQPTVNAVVDLDGGGRFLCQMTDVDEREVGIGMRVEIVLRRLREAESMHHYYWKCRPLE